MTEKHCQNCKYFEIIDDSWVYEDGYSDPGILAVCGLGYFATGDTDYDIAKDCADYEEKDKDDNEE